MAKIKQIVECVPNFSEGRDMNVIRQITDEIEGVKGVNTPALSKATVQTKSTAPKAKSSASASPASNSKSKNENSVSKTKNQKSSSKSKSKNEKENLIAEMNSFVAGLDVSGIQNLKSTSVT